MPGNGYVEEWSINLWSFQPTIMVKGDVTKPLRDDNWEFTVLWMWSIGHRFNHLTNSFLDWLMLICFWRAQMNIPYSEDHTGRLYEELQSCCCFCFIFLVYHRCVLVHFWYFYYFIDVWLYTSNNGRLRSIVIFSCNFHWSHGHCGCSFFESQSGINTISPLLKKMYTSLRKK
jgi:hypothetical protein